MPRIYGVKLSPLQQRNKKTQKLYGVKPSKIEFSPINLKKNSSERRKKSPNSKTRRLADLKKSSLNSSPKHSITQSNQIEKIVDYAIKNYNTPIQLRNKKLLRHSQ
jgi:hypothetical protein